MPEPEAIEKISQIAEEIKPELEEDFSSMEEELEKGLDGVKSKKVEVELDVEETAEETEVELEETEEEPEEEPETKPDKTGADDFNKKISALEERNRALEDRFANKMDLMNWAAKNDPEILKRFYMDLADSQMRARGLPGVKTPAESPLKGKINPTTGEEYTGAEIEQVTKTIRDMGFVTRQELEEKDQEAQTVKAREKAGENVKTFRTAWEKRVKPLNLDWDKQVEPGMSKIMEGFGLTLESLDRVTPENLAHAFNLYMLSVPGGIEMFLKNAEASAIQKEKNKQGVGRTIPAKGTKPTKSMTLNEMIKDALEKGEFDKAEKLLMKAR